jgi:hypothetical protein
MFGTQKNKKYHFMVLIAGIIILASFLGGVWQKGFAQTSPTVPAVIEIDPTVIPVNSGIGIFTIFGPEDQDPAPFLPALWGMEYTEVRWYGPDSNPLECTINPNSVNAAGTQIVVDFLDEDFDCPADLFAVAGTAEIYVVNHPESGDVREIFGPIKVNIINPPTYLFLPAVFK